MFLFSRPIIPKKGNSAQFDASVRGCAAWAALETRLNFLPSPSLSVPPSLASLLLIRSKIFQLLTRHKSSRHHGKPSGIQSQVHISQGPLTFLSTHSDPSQSSPTKRRRDSSASRASSPDGVRPGGTGSSLPPSSLPPSSPPAPFSSDVEVSDGEVRDLDTDAEGEDEADGEDLFDDKMME